jgi:hypothetical protein
MILRIVPLFVVASLVLILKQKIIYYHPLLALIVQPFFKGVGGNNFVRM